MTTKGKLVKRSWADLPHEVVRLVAEDVVNNPTWIPATWKSSTRHSSHRHVWTVLLNAHIMSNLQNVCRGWETALNTAPFWARAINELDPRREHSAHHRKSTKQLPDGVVFRHIINSSCIPCRINSFYDSHGIGTSARMEETPFTHVIGCCTIHQPHLFCSVCLVDAVPRALPPNPHFIDNQAIDNTGRWFMTNLQRNWDTVHLDPSVKTICQSCRCEQACTSVNRVIGSVGGMERGGKFMASKRVLTDYIHLGLGTIEDVINIVSEQIWFHQNFDDYLHRMEAQYKSEVMRRARAYGGRFTTDDEREAQRAVTHNKNLIKLRQFSLMNWAQSRVIEGIWVSPLDAFNAETLPALKSTYDRAQEYNGGSGTVVHPFSALIPEFGSDFLSTQSVVIPPVQTEEFENEMNIAFEHHLKRIVEPALKNCLTRLVAAADAKGVDVCKWAPIIGLDELLGPAFLRAPEIWCPQFNWQHHYRPISPPPISDPSEHGSSPKAHTVSDTTSSGDERTSPATTMQTTPSPSPDLKSKQLLEQPQIRNPYVNWDAEDIVSELLSLIDPPVHADIEMVPFETLPHIPCAPQFMGVHAQNIVLGMWKDLVADVFECSCSICTRTLEAAKKARNENEMLESIIPRSGDWAAYKQQHPHQRGSSPIGYDSEEDYISGDDYYDEDDDEEELDEDELLEAELDEAYEGLGNTGYTVGSNYPPAVTANVTMTPPISIPVPISTRPPPAPANLNIDPRLLAKQQQQALQRRIILPPGTATVQNIHTRMQTPGPPSLPPTLDSLSTVSSKSQSQRRSRSGSDSDYDDEERKKKRQRSSSIERVAGERRFRDETDVGGPDGEIVDGEDEHGHGRKRRRSFDELVVDDMDEEGDAFEIIPSVEGS